MKFTVLLARSTIASVLQPVKVWCGGHWWTSVWVKLWGQLWASASTLPCLEFQPRKTQVLNLDGSCDASQPDVPPEGSVEQQWGVWLLFTVLPLCLLDMHLINWNSISFHKFRPFCNSALKFLVDMSLNDLKKSLKTTGLCYLKWLCIQWYFKLTLKSIKMN